jgi:hypothetical protein
MRLFKKTVPGDLSQQEFHSYFRGIAFALSDLAGLTDQSLLVDRSFISDFVYAHGSVRPPPSDWQEWESHTMARSSPCIVYVESAISVIEDRLRLLPDEYLTPELVIVHLDRYEEYLSLTNFPIIRVRGDSDEPSSIEWVCREIMRLQ